MQTARALCHTRKLQFLCKVAADNSSETVSSKPVMPLSDDINSVCLVWECHDLECLFGTSFASVIKDADNLCPQPREIKEEIPSRDHELRLTIHADKMDMGIIADVERTRGWARLWNLTLDCGPRFVDRFKKTGENIHFSIPCPFCMSTL